MKDLLVVVDMVNGFVNFGALADKNINKVTPNIQKLIKCAKKKGLDIVAFKDCHKPNDVEFKDYPPHCIKGTAECDLIPELKQFEKDMVVIEKDTTNGFVTRIFGEIAKKINYHNVYVVGCCTDICVQNFVESYLKFNQEHNRKTNIVVVSDACYTFGGENHNAEEWHNKALNQMKNKGAKIVTIQKTECKEML